MELKTVRLDPAPFNYVLAQSHFIKTVEDVYEALVTSSPSASFGLAFCEASGDALIRHDGNDRSCEDRAVEIAKAVACGHFLAVVLKDTYPVNVLDRIKEVQEVVAIYCATSNPIEVVVAETGQGRGVLGVVDGIPPKGVEGAADIESRKALLRKIGYKR